MECNGANEAMEWNGMKPRKARMTNKMSTDLFMCFCKRKETRVVGQPATATVVRLGKNHLRKSYPHPSGSQVPSGTSRKVPVPAPNI